MRFILAGSMLLMIMLNLPKIRMRMLLAGSGGFGYLLLSS